MHLTELKIYTKNKFDVTITISEIKLLDSIFWFYLTHFENAQNSNIFKISRLLQKHGRK